MQSRTSGDHLGRRTVGIGVIVAAEELIGATGGATPVVCEPSPSFCKVFASSFPVAFSPCASWNFLVASIVESSHLPFGVPLYEPSFASAC